MPIYEYRCLDCDHEFDLMQKFSDPPADACPSCAGTVRKLISRSAFHLKGDGWYVTDYGKGSTTMSSDSDSKEKSEKKSKSDSSSKSESKTDSKSETKSTSKAESATASSKSE